MPTLGEREKDVWLLSIRHLPCARHCTWGWRYDMKAASLWPRGSSLAGGQWDHSKGGETSWLRGLLGVLKKHQQRSLIQPKG